MSDKNYISYADQDGITVADRTFDPKSEGLDPAQFSDVLKFSHLTNSTFQRITVNAGDCKENALDANRLCANVTVSDFELNGGKQASIVTKGGCQNMTYRNGMLVPHAKAWVDVLWDDWSDQSQEPSSGLLDNVWRADGKPVRVVFGRWKKPVMINGNYKIRWIYTAGLHVYNIIKGLFF